MPSAAKNSGQASTWPASSTAQYSALKSSISWRSAVARAGSMRRSRKRDRVIAFMASEPHHFAVVAIHGADRGFRDQRGGAADIAGIELEHVGLGARAAHALLHELHRLVVLPAEKAGRAHQVALAQPVLRHFIGGVLGAQQG